MPYNLNGLKSEIPARGQVLLLVDAGAESVRLVRKAFRVNRLVTGLIVVKTTEEALEVLLRQGRHARGPKANMVLIEMSLPCGVQAIEEFIRKIKTDRSLESIPVIAMGSANIEPQVSRIYAARANCFIETPSDAQRFEELIVTTCQFWLAVANWSSSGTMSAAVG